MATKMSNVSLHEFLQRHFITKDSDKPITNTRIADKSNGISGGSYHIPDDEYDTFLNIYYKEVFVKESPEYLTEKQRDDIGPIVVDLDFRYAVDVTTRQHTYDNIMDLMSTYLEELKSIYSFDETTAFDVFVFEKPEVNIVEEKQMTKDGIHMIIGIQADRITQTILRSKILDKISEVFDELPITNSWEDVMDEGITAGFVNWQLFGSKKPNNMRYELVYAYTYKYDPDDQEFSMEAINIGDIKNLLPKLSVRYRNHPVFPFSANFAGLHEKKVLENGGSIAISRKNGSQSAASARRKVVLNGGASSSSDMFASGITIQSILSIKTKDQLNMAIDAFLESIDSTEYHLREAHEYTMILPEAYYGKGSFLKWIRVGWALCNVSDRMFLTWVAFSSKSPDFNLGHDIYELYEKWRSFERNNPEGLTIRSIMYWAKRDALADYNTIRMNGIDYYIDKTLESLNVAGMTDSKVSGCGDYDLAKILYQMYKDEYVCVSIANNIWYRFKKNRWQQIDSGTNLRKSISEELRGLYHTKLLTCIKKLATLEEGSDLRKRMECRTKKIAEVTARLAKASDIKNIMTSAKDIFHDEDFMEKLDTNPYLLGFNNGVIDFKEKCFRKGYPDDYISKTTKIDYIPLNRDPMGPQVSIIREIQTFMSQLFPIPELHEYMWQHLASTLIGTSSNQTFNMYLGIGQNGKSVLVKLMEDILGEYKGDVPLTLITQQRTKVGGLAPELVALKGVRYAVMQEPSKGDKINEGIMKQITSGIDPIQCRAPYMTKILTYIPQFKLVVCTNELMEIKSNDHGTWRRIRVCDFVSLFTENPVKNDTEKPYQFKIDKNIIEKFKGWKEIFMSMLVEKAFETEGNVTDCAMVMASSNSYRAKQDYIAEFIEDKITTCENGRLKKTELGEEFRNWYISTYGRNVPNAKEVYGYIDKKFGKFDKAKGVWTGIKIRYERDYDVYMENEEGETDKISDGDEEDYGL